MAVFQVSTRDCTLLLRVSLEERPEQAAGVRPAHLLS